MVFCWMLLLSEKSETHLSYRNTCKLPSQKKIRSIGWLYNDLGVVEMGREKISIFSKSENWQKSNKMQRKIIVFWILRIISTQWHEFDWIEMFTNIKIGFFTPKIILIYFHGFLLAKHYQIHKKYSIFLLQSISSHFKHIIIVWKCLKIK